MDNVFSVIVTVAWQQTLDSMLTLASGFTSHGRHELAGPLYRLHHELLENPPKGIYS